MTPTDATPPVRSIVLHRIAGPALAAVALAGLAACKPAAPTTEAAAPTTAAAPADATPRVTADTPATANAFRPTMTAVELASAYATDAASAKKQFAHQPLLVTGMVVDASGSVVHLNAGDFPALEVHGLAADVATKLTAGQQILLACDGADLGGEAVSADKCSMTK